MSLTLHQKIQAQILLFKSLAKNRNFWIIITTDIVLIILAHHLALIIRFADTLSALELFTESYPSLQILLIVITIPVYYGIGMYQGMWRYTSYRDVVVILKGTLYSGAIILTILLFSNRFAGYSRSVFILDILFIFLLITAHRVSIRFFYTQQNNSRKLITDTLPQKKKRLLLIGAGSSAEKVLREIQDNPKIPYDVIGMVDDDPDKTGLKIHGVPVVGLTNDLMDHIRRTDAREILIAISSISGPAMQHLVTLCQQTGIPYKALPGISEIINGKVSLKTMRDISYADLLGREEVKLNQDEIGSYLTDKIVFVTGAGGSIGSELCRQILRFSPRKIILFDASEENLYSIQMELVHEHNYTNTVAILGRVQDQGLLELTFQKHQPSVVFHAAAYKHVPLVENNPWQAIHNNVFAAQLLLEAAILHRVERFVLVSTDKAVRPTNVMGASKRLTELLMLAYGKDKWDGSFCPARSRFLKQSVKHNTIFMAVRFGNVLGSSGSVIPLFKRQIELGGPVTVTHPDISPGISCPLKRQPSSSSRRVPWAMAGKFLS